MLSPLFDRAFLEDRGKKEGERRLRERTSFQFSDDLEEVQFFPLPDQWTGSGKVILLDESGIPFVLQNRAGEDTGLVFSRCSYVVAPSSGQLQLGPRIDSIFYPSPISRLITDLNSVCALTFGGRMPYNRSDVANFGEKVDARKILELISKNNLWGLIRSLWSSGKAEEGDIILVDGALNVIATPHMETVDCIDEDLHQSGITLVGLSKSFAPKCADIVAYGRQLHPNRAFIFTIPKNRILDSHAGAEDNQMILTLGPTGRTLGLRFGIVFSRDPSDHEYHGLFISYRHSFAHRIAVEQRHGTHNPVKVFEPIPFDSAFIDNTLVPIGGRLLSYSRSVVSPTYPLPAGAVHSHVLVTAQDVRGMIEACLASMLEGGETLRYLEYDSTHPHDVVDVILNRFYGR